MRDNFDVILMCILGCVILWAMKQNFAAEERKAEIVAAELAHRGKVANPKYRRDEFGNCFYLDVDRLSSRQNLVSVSCEKLPESQIVGINEINEIKRSVK